MRKTGNAVQLMLPISLICAFALTAALTVAFGARVFAGVSARLESSFSVRTALAYISEKSRQSSAVTVEPFDGGTALAFDAVLGGVPCTTWIYHSDGRLYEVTLASGSEAKRGDGQAVLELDGFSAEARDGLIRVAVLDGEFSADAALAGGMG